MDLPLPVNLDRKVIYDGRKIRLELHEIEEPGGRRSTREVARHPGSVAIVALRDGSDGRRELLLEHNYRYPLERYLVEIPAGTLDVPDELPIDCAKRELIEETGYRALSIRPLISLHPSPGLLSEMITIFIADRLEPTEAAPEAGELIRVEWVPLDEVLQRISRNEITDAKTIVAVLYARMAGAVA